MSKLKSLAFRVEYNSGVRAIKTYVNLYNISSPPSNNGIHIEAVWDTGATNSVITSYIAQQLMLSPIDTTRIIGVNDDEPVTAAVALVHILLPNNGLIPSRRVTIVKKIGGGVQMLMGMDIISLGDFLISNAGRKTAFSFVIPPFPDQPNWVERSNQINNGII
jgi:predicted aspartyl protease